MLNTYNTFFFYLILFASLLYFITGAPEHIRDYFIFVDGFKGFGLLLAVGFIFIAAFLLPKSFQSPSDLILHLMFILPILPMLVIYVTRDVSFEFLLYCCVGFLVVVATLRLGPSIDLGGVGSPTVSIVLCVAAILLCIVNMQLSGAFEYFNLDPWRVYDNRRRTDAIVFSGLFGYLTNFAFYYGGIFIFSFFLYYRKYGYFLIFAGFYIVIFGGIGHKGIAAVFFQSVILFAILNSRNVLRNFIISYTALVLGVSIIGFYGDVFEVHTLIIRRLFFAPAMINYYYFDVFNEYGYVFWRDSILRHFMEYPFEYPPPNLVSVAITGYPYSHVNAGYLGSGFQQAGPVGILLYAVLIGLLLRLYDRLVQGRMPLILATIPVFHLFLTASISSDLPGLLASGGGFLMFVTVFLYVSPRGTVDEPDYSDPEQVEHVGR